MKTTAVGAVALLAGALAAVAAVVLLQDSARLQWAGERTTGTVVRLERGAKSYYPVFAFADRAGTRYEIRSPAGASPPAYEVGESVVVYFPAGAPEEAALGGFFSLWFRPVVLGLLAVLGFAVFQSARRGTLEME